MLGAEGSNSSPIESVLGLIQRTCVLVNAVQVNRPFFQFPIQHQNGRESKSDEVPENGIKVKEEFLEDEEEILTEQQSTMEPSEYRESPIDQNEFLEPDEAVDQFYPCSICGFTFGSRKKFKYHKVS